MNGTRFLIHYLFLLTFCITQRVNGQVLSGVQDNVSQAASQLAPLMANAIETKQGAAKYQVVVFPFGNNSGKTSRSFGSSGKVMQGELIHHLTKESLASGGGEKFTVLDVGAIRQRFGALSSADFNNLSSSDPMAIASVMGTVTPKADVAIVGSFATAGYNDAIDSGQTDIAISGRLVFLDGSSTPFSFKLNRDDIGEIGGGGSNDSPTGRFAVEVIVDGSPRSFKTSTVAGFQYVHFLELDPSDKGKDYKIRVKNKGTPKIVDNSTLANDNNRLFGVAILVDGVNSVFEKVEPTSGATTFKPVIRHPFYVRKWILTGPDQFFKNGILTSRGPSDPDHSDLRLPGFQKLTGGLGEVAKFQFADISTSVASQIGILNDVGIIEVHIYPQKLPGDATLYSYHAAARSGDIAGTRPGPTEPHPTQNVSVDLYGNPKEVWRIHYYYKGNRPEDDNGTPLIP
jgi:hypothetical protein